MKEKERKEMMNEIEMLKKIQAEYVAACEKHPKFCDDFTAFDMQTAVAGEVSMKLANSEGPYQADILLQEEIWEATTAYLKGDKAHALQELAQCGAVILRMMEFVQNEMESEN